MCPNEENGFDNEKDYDDDNSIVCSLLRKNDDWDNEKDYDNDYSDNGHGDRDGPDDDINHNKFDSDNDHNVNDKPIMMVMKNMMIITTKNYESWW